MQVKAVGLSLHAVLDCTEGKYHTPAPKSGREMNIPGAAHRPAWKTSSNAECLDLFSEDFDHLPNILFLKSFQLHHVLQKVN